MLEERAKILKTKLILQRNFLSNAMGAMDNIGETGWKEKLKEFLGSVITTYDEITLMEEEGCLNDIQLSIGEDVYINYMVNVKDLLKDINEAAVNLISTLQSLIDFANKYLNLDPSAVYQINNGLMTYEEVVNSKNPLTTFYILTLKHHAIISFIAEYLTHANENDEEKVKVLITLVPNLFD